MGAYDTPGNAQAVAVRDSMAYVADGSAGLRLISVANPSAPTEVGFYDTPGDAQGVAVVGDYAYVADGAGGLRIISVTDTAHLRQVGSITPDSIGAVAVTSDGLAHVTSGYDGSLYVINVTDPTHPVQVGFYRMSGNAHGLAIADGLAYVANGEGGLMILRYRPSSLTASFIASPTSGLRPLTVAFTDTSTVEVDSRLWSFGDGITSTFINPTHTYTSLGVYTVTLTVNGPDGEYTDIKPSLIAVLEPAAYLPLVMRDYASTITAGPRFVASSGTDTGNDCRIPPHPAPPRSTP